MAKKPFTPYSSAAPFFTGAVPAGLSGLDADRVRSYQLYEEFYYNHPESYALYTRADDSDPIYLPSARKIIEATNRYLAVGWDFTIPKDKGTTAEQETLRALVQATFRREAMYTKFANQRRNCLIRGDAIWHITADDTKPLGARVSLHEVNPAQYFPIYDFDDRMIGVHLVDDYPDPKDSNKTVTRRQTYRKLENGGISTELALFENGKWDDRDEDNEIKLIQVLRPVEPLPPQITQIPLYHIRNTYNSDWPFGSSTLRGIETVCAGLLQGVSDQALAVALGGLGIWVTTAGPPKDVDGNITAWDMSPNRVTEIPEGSILERRGELSTIAPSVDHLNFVIGETQAGVGIPDIAAGKVDVAVAESGIALTLQLSPLLSSNAEKEQAWLGVYDQMFYDLIQMWFPAYEGFTPSVGGVELLNVVGDPIPVNRDARIKEIQALHDANLITTDMAISELTELGYTFPANAAAQLLEQQAARTAATDPFSTRTEAELNGAGGNSNGRVPAGAN